MSLQRSFSDVQSVTIPSENTAKSRDYIHKEMFTKPLNLLTVAPQLFNCAYERSVEEKQLSTIDIDAPRTQDRTDELP